ncbi:MULTISPECIES: hypothetical protein [unclassified Paenibacillus]|uniref:hypothetical protein n=1 Tax=unclassified Paenibacillus TaxID=185978 RepID=UPI000FE271DE|nr:MULTISPECIES: hypothetical protein [unclassified Paenibacillus]MCM3171058.1 hypothetical protein [Paenibacillus sp. MER 99-2]
MSLLDWVFDNLYIVAVVGFMLFSFLGKAAKSADPNKKRPSNGMPTFGGSGDSDRNGRSSEDTRTQSTGPSNQGDTRYDEQYDDRYDDRRYDEETYDDRYEPMYSEPASSSRQSDEYSGQSTVSAMSSSLEEQMKQMEQQQREIQERLNRISSANTPVVSDSSWDETTGESGQSLLRREDIRTGVLWAEVLGSPRSKQPFGTRGKL